MIINKEMESLGQKVLKDFKSAFQKHRAIKEVCIIPAEEQLVNMSPIQVQECSLGIESWCVKYLFRIAYNTLMGKLKTDESFQFLSRCVVIFCPDCATAWNMRKELLVREGLESLVDELNLTRLSLAIRPKSSEVFAHRRWLVKRLLNLDPYTVSCPTKLRFCSTCWKPLRRKISFVNEHCLSDLSVVTREMSLCNEFAALHPSNYAAWSHRVWTACLVFSQLLIFSKHTSPPMAYLQNLLDLLTHDLSDVMVWMRSHVSDHSCMSYVEFLLQKFALFKYSQENDYCSCAALLCHDQPLMCSSTKIDIMKLWEGAMKQNKELLLLHDGEHEALWSHRRALLLLFDRLLRKMNKNRPQNDISLQHESEFCDTFVNITDVVVQSRIKKYLNFIKSNVFYRYVLHQSL